MKDINPIMSGIPINIINSIIFIVFIIILYFLWQFLNKNNNINKVSLDPCKPKDFSKILEIFEKKYINVEKEIFYTKLSKILKEILESKGYKNISKMTFEEIDKKLSTNDFSYLKELIKNIYFKQYVKEIIDSEEIRKKILLEIKKLI